MAKKFSNGVNVATGFKVSGANPIDDREQVETFLNLLDQSSIIDTDLRPWIEVITADDGKKYKWNGQDRTQQSNWEEVGTSSGGGNGAALTTGILTGGEVTINANPTLVDISAGSGVVFDWDNPSTPKRYNVFWPEMLGVSIPVATGIFTTLSIDKDGVLVKVTDVPMAPETRRKRIFLQTVVHASGVQVDAISEQSNPAYEVVESIMDYVKELGAINSGNKINPNGATLTLSKDAGKTTLPFINRANSTENPATKTNESLTPIPNITKVYRDGVGGFVFDNSNNEVNPSQYDDGDGTLSNTGNNNWTIQRVHFFGQTNTVSVSYGQQVYGSFSEAESSIFTELPILSPITDLGIFIAAIVVKGNATELDNLADAKIYEIGNVGTSSSGAAIGDMQKSVYDPLNNGYVDDAGKLHLIINSLTANGSVSFDLNTFTNFDLLLDGNVTSLNLSNGELYQQRVVNISKDADGYYFDIADDYSDTLTYSTGDVVGVESQGSILGRIYYKANQDILTPEPFDSAKWDLYIKLQDDVAITPSYSSNIIDQLQVTPKLKGGVMYYAITPIYNVGEK